MNSSTLAATRQITARDGHEFDSWMQPATGTRRGGLVILQEIFGVTDQLKGVAEKYAAQGLDVAVPALFDRKERHAVIPFDDGPRGRELMLSLDKEEIMADVAATVAALAEDNDKVAVIGFCWGGGLALRCAQELEVAGAVAFYGTRLTSYLDQPLRAPMQFHFGNQDDHSPPEVIEQTRAALPDAEIFLYDTGHAFANDARATYVADAADTAHQRTAEFLDRIFV